jgi:hypothetical protein
MNFSPERISTVVPPESTHPGSRKKRIAAKNRSKPMRTQSATVV